MQELYIHLESSVVFLVSLYSIYNRIHRKIHTGNTSGRIDSAGKVGDCSGYSGYFRGNNRLVFEPFRRPVSRYAETANMAVLHRRGGVNTDKITREFDKNRGAIRKKRHIQRLLKNGFVILTGNGSEERGKHSKLPKSFRKRKKV